MPVRDMLVRAHTCTHNGSKEDETAYRRKMSDIGIPISRGTQTVARASEIDNDTYDERSQNKQNNTYIHAQT